MRALLQRVKKASVIVDEEVVGKIEQGLLVFLAVQKQDACAHADKLLNKLLRYRIFADADEKMNLSLEDIGGGLLIVSQFTLAADTQKGLRPSFSSAAAPDKAEALYDYVVQQAQGVAQQKGFTVASGRFGADMQIALVNDGPVTFLLEQTTS